MQISFNHALDKQGTACSSMITLDSVPPSQNGFTVEDQKPAVVNVKQIHFFVFSFL